MRFLWAWTKCPDSKSKLFDNLCENDVNSAPQQEESKTFHIKREEADGIAIREESLKFEVFFSFRVDRRRVTEREDVSPPSNLRFKINRQISKKVFLQPSGGEMRKNFNSERDFFLRYWISDFIEKNATVVKWIGEFR